MFFLLALTKRISEFRITYTSQEMTLSRADEYYLESSKENNSSIKTFVSLISKDILLKRIRATQRS